MFVGNTKWIRNELITLRILQLINTPVTKRYYSDCEILLIL